MLSAAVRTPAAVGLKLTWKPQEVPLFSDAAQLFPETVKSPALVGMVMPVTVEPELFMTVTD